MYYYEGFCIITENSCSRSPKPRADEVIFSEEKFQKPLLINFFAWEKKLCFLLHGLTSRRNLKPSTFALICESVTEQSSNLHSDAKPAGGHWMRPSHSTPQRVHSGNDLAWECQTNMFQGKFPIAQPSLAGQGPSQWHSAFVTVRPNPSRSLP